MESVAVGYSKILVAKNSLFAAIDSFAPRSNTERMREDFPEPDTPQHTVSLFMGKPTDKFFRFRKLTPLSFTHPVFASEGMVRHFLGSDDRSLFSNAHRWANSIFNYFLGASDTDDFAPARPAPGPMSIK